MRTILVGLDGSEYAAAAVELGIRWARRFEALLVGLAVIDEPTIRAPEPMPIGAGAFKEQKDAARVHRAGRQVEQFLEQFALRCAGAGVAHKVLEDAGAPAERIVTQAQRYDLLLLGRETHFHFVTQDGPDDTLKVVLRNTPRPVVATPNQLGDGAAVVVAYDGSLQAARAVQAFQASGLGDGAAVHVLSAGPDRAEAVRHADRAVEFLSFHQIKATPHVVAPAAATAGAILEQARQLDAGLLVMGCYGQSTLREFFLGSVTSAVLQQATVPLFLYH